MARFLGIAQHTMDGKGRVSLPAKYRGELAVSELVLVEGIEQCIWLYRKEDYDKLIAPLTDDDLDETLDDLNEFFIAGAFNAEVDSAGRIRVPAEMRDYAQLSKAVSVVGKANRLELWDSEIHAARRTRIDKKAALAELRKRGKAAQG
jgi:MraZ protein